MNTQMESIHTAVCSYFGVPKSYPFQKTRNRQVTEKRQIIHYFAKKHTILALRQIGAYDPHNTFDHATVMHSIKSIEDKMQFEQAMRADIAAIDNLISVTQAKFERSFIKTKEQIINEIEKTKNKTELMYYLKAYVATSKMKHKSLITENV